MDLFTLYCRLNVDGFEPTWLLYTIWIIYHVRLVASVIYLKNKTKIVIFTSYKLMVPTDFDFMTHNSQQHALKIFFWLVFYIFYMIVYELALLRHMAQIIALGFRLVSGETLLQEKNSAGRRWDSNPGPCR